MKPGNRRHLRRTVLNLAETTTFLTDEKGARTMYLHDPISFGSFFIMPKGINMLQWAK
jgi:hypothetical protein